MSTKIKIENGKRQRTSGQIIHRVFDGDEQIGQLYNNADREAMQHAERYIFSPRSSRGFSVWLDHPRKEYVDHAGGVRSNDREDIVERIVAWREACIAERSRIESEFRAVLDALPEVEYELRGEGDIAHGAGVRCKALGGDKMESVKVDLTWGQIAKLLAHSYDECQQWQAQDIRFGGRGWELEWRYVRGADTIQLQTYGRTTVLSARRSEAHKAVDKQGVAA